MNLDITRWRTPDPHRSKRIAFINITAIKKFRTESENEIWLNVFKGNVAFRDVLRLRL